MREGAGGEGGGTGATRASLGRLQVLDYLYQLRLQVALAADNLAPVEVGLEPPEVVDLVQLALS